MPFNVYKTQALVVSKFGIRFTESMYMPNTDYPVDPRFSADLDFMLREAIVDNSEYAICENLIYPILREVWREYNTQFVVWSHQPLYYDDDLSGVPDYIIAKRSPLGKVVFERPCLIIVEAKRDNFEEGWGQCMAEMLAAQKINQKYYADLGIPAEKYSEQIVYGIVSNGDAWKFGKLQMQTFTKNIRTYTIYDLEKLFSALHEIFKTCRQQLELAESIDQLIF